MLAAMNHLTGIGSQPAAANVDEPVVIESLQDMIQRVNESCQAAVAHLEQFKEAVSRENEMLGLNQLSKLKSKLLGWFWSPRPEQTAASAQFLQDRLRKYAGFYVKYQAIVDLPRAVDEIVGVFDPQRCQQLTFLIEQRDLLNVPIVDQQYSPILEEFNKIRLLGFQIKLLALEIFHLLGATHELLEGICPNAESNLNDGNARYEYTFVGKIYEMPQNVMLTTADFPNLESAIHQSAEIRDLMQPGAPFPFVMPDGLQDAWDAKFGEIVDTVTLALAEALKQRTPAPLANNHVVVQMGADEPA
jgi:hypothetical protein